MTYNIKNHLIDFKGPIIDLDYWWEPTPTYMINAELRLNKTFNVGLEKLAATW